MNHDLATRTLAFALRSLEFVDRLPRSLANQVCGRQFVKSSTAVGAFFREAARAETRKDFVHEIGLVTKEACESEYWLQIFERRVTDPDVALLLAESRELAACGG